MCVCACVCVYMCVHGVCVCVYGVCVCVCVCVGSSLATKVFIGNSGCGKGVGHHKVGKSVMNGGQLPTNHLHDINYRVHSTMQPN